VVSHLSGLTQSIVRPNHFSTHGLLSGMPRSSWLVDLGVGSTRASLSSMLHVVAGRWAPLNRRLNRALEPSANAHARVALGQLPPFLCCVESLACGTGSSEGSSPILFRSHQIFCNRLGSNLAQPRSTDGLDSGV
jgi:hypothetical protein